MKRSGTLLLATTLLVFSATVYAQDAPMAREEAAIRRVVQLYFGASNSHDAEALARATHPGAKGFYVVGDRLGEVTRRHEVAAYREARRRGVPPFAGTLKIVSVDVTGGEAASVKVEMEHPTTAEPDLVGKLRHESSTVTEYLLLLKFADGWKVVSKVQTSRWNEAKPE